MTKKLVSWKGRRVEYKDGEPCYQHPDDAATFVRIFCPEGPPGPENFKDSVGKPEEYTPEVEMAYRHLKEHGVFKDGILPAVPPKPEWCSFDL
jgi:nucleoporin NUP42